MKNKTVPVFFAFLENLKNSVKSGLGNYGGFWEKECKEHSCT